RAVRFVFDPLDRRRHVALGALEIDIAQRPLVTAAAEAHGDAAIHAAAARGRLALGKRLDGLALPQARAIDDDQLPQAGRFWFECFQRHDLPQSPVVTSMDWPSSRVTMAFLMSLRCARLPLNTLSLPLCTSVLTRFTF